LAPKANGVSALIGAKSGVYVQRPKNINDEEAYKIGQKPVGTDMIENVLAKDINGLEPRLTRQGYNAKVLADLLNIKPREIKSFLSGHLAPGRTQELQTELLAAGIPL
jgi:hypothetical protein